MLVALPVEFGPGVAVPSVNGVRVVYPAWLGVVWAGLLVAQVLLTSSSG